MIKDADFQGHPAWTFLTDLTLLTLFSLCVGAEDPSYIKEDGTILRYG